MNGPTHIAGGVLAGAFLVETFHGTSLHGTSLQGTSLQGTSLPYIGIAVLAALIPDWLQVNIPGGSQLARGVFGHRGISHWLLTAGAIAFLIKQFSPTIAMFALAGWGSHIVLDLFSDGVPALWPLPRITLAHIKSGSWMDAVVGATLLIMAIVIMLRRAL